MTLSVQDDYPAIVVALLFLRQTKTRTKKAAAIIKTPITNTVTPIFNEQARDNELMEAGKKTGLWKTTLDAKKAVADADFVYTDTWIDMEFFTDPKFAAEKEKRLKQMMPYQINSALLKGSNAYIMHDMPIHRGYEISSDVIENPKSVIYEQAENRLYSAKAILLKLLST